ncbi:56kDa selenium binding family protein [Mycobacterium xenopi 4042]|uniref:56kDa selenium binding family protein n=1 Tax=Mycobacterium xenopi 4042 TaxID=1299334 RepID=X8DNL4_MYCXE|nr:56kDa selenium binding family protein [Mycobacterium xenopi 4042]
MIGPWEVDRGPQFFAYDVWWHLRHDTLVTSEWATPSMLENGLNPEDLLGRKFGHHLNFWNMSERKLIQRIDLGDQHQMVLELRRPTTRQDLGFRRRGDQRRGPIGLGVVVAQGGDQWPSTRSSRSRPSPPTRRAATGPAAVRCGATAGLGHRSLRRRPVAVRILLGDR